MRDRLKYPGFWSDVYMRWMVLMSQEQVVEATLAVVRSDG